MFSNTGSVIPSDEAQRIRVTGGILRISATRASITRVFSREIAGGALFLKLIAVAGLKRVVEDTDVDDRSRGQYRI